MPLQLPLRLPMTAFLTATVRPPVTGMILIFEMTGSFNQAVSMPWACFAAMAVPTLMGNSRIYDSMRTRISGVAKTMWWPIVQINDTRCHGIDVRV